jgi:hypothetical protein
MCPGLELGGHTTPAARDLLMASGRAPCVSRDPVAEDRQGSKCSLGPIVYVQELGVVVLE